MFDRTDIRPPNTQVTSVVQMSLSVTMASASSTTLAAITTPTAATEVTRPAVVVLLINCLALIRNVFPLKSCVMVNRTVMVVWMKSRVVSVYRPLRGLTGTLSSKSELLLLCGPLTSCIKWKHFLVNGS